MTPHTIYFVRHGETEWNLESRLQGGGDSPLTALGREQARRAGETLAEVIPAPSAVAFVASPLGRARTTMEILLERLGFAHTSYKTDERLAEMRFGAWEGLTWPYIRSSLSDAWSAREAQKWTYAPDGGESFAQVAERVRAWMQSLSGDVVAVGHGAAGRVLRGLYLGMPETKIPASANHEQGRVYRYTDGTETAF